MRRLSAVAAVLVLVVLVPPLWNLATSTVTIPDGWTPWVWVVTVPLVIAAFLIELRNRSGRPAELIGGGIGLDEAANRLATAVHVEWQREEERRRVHYPFSLPVRWHNAPEAQMDHPANVCRPPAGTTPEPLDLTGELDRIVEIYQLIPSGRLVILGRAGSGKTILALRFVLDLLDARTTTDPVPVIFSLGSWNPTTTSLRDWLADQLIRDHPGVAAPGPAGGSLATALIGTGRILPVLDGFDEIAQGLHRAALAELNATGMPLLVTSRPDEFAEAVAGTDVLTSAAGITLTDLTLTDLVNYLPRTTRKATSTGTTTAPVWDPVLNELRDHPHSLAGENLTAVLTTPLMVILARAIYSDTPDHNPSVLLDTDRFPTPEAVEDHLLGNFIPTVYRHQPGDHRHWDPERVQHWLGYLAQHLGGNLAWWQLGNTMRRSSRMLLVGVVVGLVIGLLEWLVSGLVVELLVKHEPKPGLGLEDWLSYERLVDGLLVGLAAGLAFGLAHGLMTKFGGATIEPLRVRVQILGETRGARARFVPRFRIGLVLGLMFGLMVALLGWLVAGLLQGLVGPLDNVLGQVLLWGLMGALGGGLGYVLSLTAWGQWVVLSRIWLPLTGRLPWALLAFLDDAHQRGVLRQAGAVYQFRHARLQDHLTHVFQTRRDLQPVSSASSYTAINQ